MPRRKDEDEDLGAHCEYCELKFDVPSHEGDFQEAGRIRRIVVMDIHLIRELEEGGPGELHKHLALNYSFEEKDNKSKAEGAGRNKQAWIQSQLRNAAELNLERPDGTKLPAWMAWAKDHGVLGLWFWVNARMQAFNPEPLDDLPQGRPVTPQAATRGMKIVRMVATKQMTAEDGQEAIRDLFSPLQHR